MAFSLLPKNRNFAGDTVNPYTDFEKSYYVSDQFGQPIPLQRQEGNEFIRPELSLLLWSPRTTNWKLIGTVTVVDADKGHVQVEISYGQFQDMGSFVYQVLMLWPEETVPTTLLTGTVDLIKEPNLLSASASG